VESELLAVNDLINKSPNFASFLGNPTISRQDKANKVRIVTIIRKKNACHL
jgi:F0F1-type ATP synthase delta subunit